MLRTIDRPPAYSVLQQVHRLQRDRLPRTRLQRALGWSPLHPEARSWYAGALGELTVARLLSALPPEWTTLHSVPLTRAGTDVDHIVIGPAGVFTINTKRHAGKAVWVAGRTIMIAGQRHPYIAKAEAEEKRVQARLRELHGVEVQPVIALVDVEGLTEREKPARVAVVRAQDLAVFLHRRPVSLTIEQQRHAERLLSSDDAWATPDDEAPLPDGWFDALQQEVASARRRATLLSVAVVLLATSLTITPILLLPAIANALLPR